MREFEIGDEVTYKPCDTAYPAIVVAEGRQYRWAEKEDRVFYRLVMLLKPPERHPGLSDVQWTEELAQHSRKCVRYREEALKGRIEYTTETTGGSIVESKEFTGEQKNETPKVNDLTSKLNNLRKRDRE